MTVHAMRSSHLVELGVISPLGAAVVELHTVRGWDFEEAVAYVQSHYDEDHHVPVSGLFTPRMIVEFYAERGEPVNPVPLPRG